MLSYLFYFSFWEMGEFIYLVCAIQLAERVDITEMCELQRC